MVIACMREGEPRCKDTGAGAIAAAQWVARKSPEHQCLGQEGNDPQLNLTRQKRELRLLWSFLPHVCDLGAPLLEIRVIKRIVGLTQCSDSSTTTEHFVLSSQPPLSALIDFI